MKEHIAIYDLQRGETGLPLSADETLKSRRFEICCETQSGKETDTKLLVYCPQRIGLRDMMEQIMEWAEEQGIRLTYAAEITENSKICRYMAVGYIEELFSDIGEPVPTNIVSIMRRAFGEHLPVNWIELENHWR